MKRAFISVTAALIMMGICTAAEARIENTYGYTLKGDPYNSMQIKQAKDPFMGNVVNEAYYLRDEDFFGKGSASGKLNYDIDDLAAVKAAAESGDYELAKKELLNYYRLKTYNKDKISSSTDIMTADLLTKNFMYNARSGLALQSYMYVDGTAKYTSADVTGAFKTYSASRSQMTFMVLADDKDKYTVSFDSKEGANTPYIKVVSGGKEKTLYPVDDTYINASTNASKNFGSSTVLQACESAIGTTDLVNVYTKRIYLKFDTSSLGNVSSAKLYMHGYNQSADENKELVVFYSDDSTWQEETATYNKVLPQVIYSYDQDDSWGWNAPSGCGARYPEELLRFDTWFDKLVKAYNSTGDEKYAYTALRQLMDFINVCGDKPTHRVTLDVAVRTQCLPKLFMQLLDSEYMTPDIFTAFMKYMYVEANASKNFTRDGNWGTSESEGLFITAVYFREFSDSDAWINRVRQRYEELLGDIVNDDCSSTELSLGYVDYTISTVIGAKTVADSLGTDISPYSERTLESLEKLGLYMSYMSMPGMRDNQMGDGYSYTGSYKSRSLFLGDWFNNPVMLYTGSGGSRGTVPDKTSILFPDGRKAVMRSDWTNNAKYLYTNVDGGVGNHGHADDNEIVMYAYGGYLLIDPLYGTYSASESRTWLMSSIAHNTVTMNGKNQNYGGSGKKGTIDSWQTDNGCDYIKETSVNVPDAEKYTRSILSVNHEFYIVNDYIVPKNASSNKYVQAWHFLPSANINIDSISKETATNMNGANIQVIPINSAALSRAEKVSGLYSSGQGSVENAYYTEYEKNVSGNAVFDTILIPRASGKAEKTVSVSELSDTAEVTAYTLTIDGKTYVYMHNNGGGETMSAGGFVTDANMLLLACTANGRYNTVTSEGMTYVYYNGEDINNEFEYPLIYDAATMDYEYDTAISIEELSKLGFSFDTTNNIYSVRKFNNANSIYRDALRFGTKQFNTEQKRTDIMSISFDEDAVNCPARFENGVYLYESEFAIQNKDSGELRLGFVSNGEPFAYLCFKRVDSGTHKYSGIAYVTDAQGNQYGRTQEIKILSDNSLNVAGELLYVKAELDMNLHEMKLWLVPRAFGSDDYTEAPAAGEHLLVSGMDIDADSFDGISFDITKNIWENSVWLCNASVNKLSKVSGKLTFKDNCLHTAVYNNTGAAFNGSVIIAQLDENGCLTGVKKEPVSVDGEYSELPIPYTVQPDAKQVKAFLWDEDMVPVAVAKAATL